MTVNVQQNLSNRKINNGSRFCMFPWVLSSLNRESVYCGLRRQSQHGRGQPVSMQDGHTNTIYNKTLQYCSFTSG